MSDNTFPPQIRQGTYKEYEVEVVPQVKFGSGHNPLFHYFTILLDRVLGLIVLHCRQAVDDAKGTFKSAKDTAKGKNK